MNLYLYIDADPPGEEDYIIIAESAIEAAEKIYKQLVKTILFSDITMVEITKNLIEFKSGELVRIRDYIYDND